jgi:hypothetical protein
MTTRVLKCNCSSSFQDKEYGQAQRLCNDNNKEGSKCTICGTIHKVDGSVKKK